MKSVKSVFNILSEIRQWNISSISHVSFDDMVSPVFLVAMCNLVNNWYLKSWELKWPSNIISYLIRSNFHNVIWLTNKLNSFTWNNDNLVELTIIKPDINLWQIDKIAQKLFIKLLGIKKGQAIDIHNKIYNTILFMVTELLSNITTHSCSDFSKNCCLYMMQYYEQTNTLRVWIVDGWVWIVKTLMDSQHYKEWESGEYYMNLSVKQFYTRDESIWAWNWLYICSRTAEETKSTLQIISHNYEYYQNWQSKEIKYNDIAFPGTLINMEFDISNVLKVDLSKLYEWRRSLPSDVSEYDDLYNSLWN